MTWEQFATRWADQHGGYDPRRAPAPVRGWLRAAYPVAQALSRAGARPRALGGIGLVLALGVPLLALAGTLGLLVAAVLVLLSTFADTLDRAVAAIGETFSPRAAIRTAVIGRLVEVAWLAGFWLAGVPGPLVVACGLATGLHVYGRTLALAAGLSPIGVNTVGERSMRVTVAAAGLALAGLAGLTGLPVAAGMLTVAAAAWLLFAGLGLSQLAGAARRALR